MDDLSATNPPSQPTADSLDPQTQAAFDKAFSPANLNPQLLPQEAPRAPAMQAEPAHKVNVVNPEGKLVSIPSSFLEQAFNTGYRIASGEELHAHEQQEKYGSAGQQAITALEGAASAATFGASTGLETAFGVKPEDIQGRRETNSGTHMAGQGLGLVGSSLLLPGSGAAHVLEAAGEGAAKLAAEAIPRLAGESAVAKIGSAAVRGAVENMAFQGGDEVSKLMSQDPNQSVQTAAVEVGLSGLLGGAIGGGIGSINPLWKATLGAKTEGMLKAISNKLGGESVVGPEMEKAISDSGVTPSPEMKATLSGNDAVRQAAKHLEQSDTTGSGRAYQKSLNEFGNGLGDSLLAASGKTAADVDHIANLSAYDAGQMARQSIISEVKNIVDPISKDFEEVRAKFKNMELPKDRVIEEPVTNPMNPYEGSYSQAKTVPGATSELVDKISTLAQEKGWIKAPSSPEMHMVNRIIKELPLQTTLEDLRNYQSLIAEDASRQQLWHFGSEVRKIFRGAEEQIIDNELGRESPELLAKHAGARAAYRDAMTTIDQLNDRLHVGRYSGPDSFLRAVKEMSPEDVLRRLSPKNDVELMTMLKQRFPQTAEHIKDFHLSDIVKAAAAKAKEGTSINARTFIDKFQKLTPEMKGFIMPEGGKVKVDAVSTILDHLAALPHNFSNTARTWDKLSNMIPASAMGLISLLTGHGAGESAVVSMLTNTLSKTVPDASRLGLLKFLGSDAPVSTPGFKSMVDFIEHTIKGENTTSRAAVNVFKAGKEVLPQSLMPDEKGRNKLDKQLKSLQSNPNDMANVGGHVSHYMPEHAQAIAQTTSSAVNFLNGIRPNTDKSLPFDSKKVPSQAQKAEYNRALDIAQQPLIVLNKIKAGTVTPQDVVALKNLYPGLYEKFSQKVTEQVAAVVEKGESIPYKTRLGLSLFLGQPLDSTMTPQAIVSAQYKSGGSSEEKQPTPPLKASTGLNKLPQAYATANQSAEQSRIVRKAS